MSTEDTNSSTDPSGSSMISPSVSNQDQPSEDQPSEQSNEENNNEQAEGDNFPSMLTCPFTFEPPLRAVMFRITEGTLSHHRQDITNLPPPSEQVFEYVDLFNYISRHGDLRDYRDVKHPTTRAAIRRDRAQSCIVDVPPSVQARISNERRLRGLPMDVPCLTAEDMTRMQATARRVRDPTIDPQEVVWSPFEGTPREVRQMNQGTAPTRRAVAAPPQDSSESDSDDSILQEPRLRNVRRRLNNGSPAAAAANGRRDQMCGFLNRERTGIRSARHAAALIAVLQLAQSSPGGIIASLGHNNRLGWITENINNGVFFAGDGPCHAFQPVGVAVFSRHLRAAQRLATTILNRDHSNEPTGAEGEAVPQWARQFTALFQEQQNQRARTSRTLQARTERTEVARSLAGAQAPLGPHDHNRPAQLRTETSRNNGAPALRQQVVGGVQEEAVPLMEERNDTSNRRQAPARRINTGTRRRNVHLNGSFSPDSNDPASRFGQITAAYQSLGALTDALTQSLTAPPPQPSRTIFDIIQEYNAVRVMMSNVPDDPSQFPNQAVYRRVLSSLAAEVMAVSPGDANVNGGDVDEGDASDHESNSVGF